MIAGMSSAAMQTLMNRRSTTIQYLSTHGLVVQPSLPHVVYACAQPETVSYEELRTLLRKG
jgi:hypothetical protein